MVFAYIDPGTGALVLQVLIAALLSAGVAFRRVLMAPITVLFGKRSGHGAASDVQAAVSKDSPKR